MVGRRTFTIAEVNRLVPELEALAQRARQAHAIAAAAQARLEELGQRDAPSSPTSTSGSAGPSPAGEPERAESGEALDLADALRAADEELQAVVSGFQRLGAEVKGLDPPLVDFLGEREGRLVWLCWTIGERRLRAWHELDAGFSGRQPL